MSLLSVLACVQAAMEDPTTGLAARVAVLRDQTASGVEVSNDFRFGEWAIDDEAEHATQPLWKLAPDTARAEWRPDVNADYQAVHALVISAQAWSGDTRIIQDSAVVYWMALHAVLSDLRRFSDAHPEHGRTIETVIDAIEAAFLTFPGRTAASHGFTCTFAVGERSRD